MACLWGHGEDEECDLCGGCHECGDCHCQEWLDSQQMDIAEVYGEIDIQ